MRRPTPGRRTRLQRVVAGALWLGSVWPAGPASASPLPESAATQEKELAIRAAIVVRLVDYVTWPAEAFSSPSAPFRICVLGEDPILAPLRRLTGRIVGDRPLEVVRFATPRELEFCPILYVSPTERERRDQILAAVAEAPVLTVGEGKDFGEAGGIVQLSNRLNRISFAVNPGAASLAGLQLDPELLRLAAREIHTRP